MREDFWEFAPTHKLWLAANHKPTVRGTDYGIWRRIRLIPFTVTIPDEEKDKHLPEKLLGELPGILAWAVRGCLQWQQVGLAEPEEVRMATDAYRAEQDVLAAFLDDRCLVHREVRTKAGDLYAAYCGWCDATGEDKVPQRRFGISLRERGFEATKAGKGVRFWIGLGLKNDD